MDIERPFGTRWQVWGKLAAVSWLAIFVLSLVGPPSIWSNWNAGCRVYGDVWMVGGGLRRPGHRECLVIRLEGTRSRIGRPMSGLYKNLARRSRP